MGIKLENRVGEVSYTKYGTKATVIEYINNKKVLVEFDDEHKYRYYTSYINFKNGSLTNPYECRNKNGIGHIGVGEYNSKDHRLAYHKWSAMIDRCFNGYKRLATKSYDGCSICDEWLNFQNFAKWFYDNYYDCNEPLCVDKDILIHGNKIYSTNTCLLVPQRINLLFIKEYGRRGNLPIGVQKSKDRHGYTSLSSMSDGYKYLGYFNDIKECFLKYKEEKEKYIKKIAEDYKNIIPNKVYIAMYNYEILITD